MTPSAPVTIQGRTFKRVYTGYKFVYESGVAPFSGFNYSEYLPRGLKRGQFLPIVSSRDLMMCVTGYHLLDDADDVKKWVRVYFTKFPATLYLCEAVGRGTSHASTSREPKTVYQSFRFIRKVKVVEAI